MAARSSSPSTRVISRSARSAASNDKVHPVSGQAGSPSGPAGAEVRRYHATYQFDGRAWICQFVDPDIATFGRTLAAARAHARSLLAVHLEVDDLASAGVEIEDQVRLPAGLDVELDTLHRQRAEAEKLRHDVAESTRRAAASLRAAGLSTRDVGDLIGVSAARVGQFEADRPSGSFKSLGVGRSGEAKAAGWTSDELVLKVAGER